MINIAEIEYRPLETGRTYLSLRCLLSDIILITFCHHKVPCIIAAHIKTCDNLPKNKQIDQVVLQTCCISPD